MSIFYRTGRGNHLLASPGSAILYIFFSRIHACLAKLWALWTCIFDTFIIDRYKSVNFLRKYDRVTNPLHLYPIVSSVTLSWENPLLCTFSCIMNNKLFVIYFQEAWVYCKMFFFLLLLLLKLLWFLILQNVKLFLLTKAETLGSF